jgi:hypothetical protein
VQAVRHWILFYFISLKKHDFTTLMARWVECTGRVSTWTHGARRGLVPPPTAVCEPLMRRLWLAGLWLPTNPLASSLWPLKRPLWWVVVWPVASCSDGGRAGRGGGS